MMTNFLITDFGAKAETDFINTEAIQKAVDAAEAAGGGRVVVPAGTWTTGTIWMKSRVELHLERGATLLGSVREQDYNPDDAFPENFHSVGEEWSGAHLILGYKVEDAAITGEGVIDANGPAFFGECDRDSSFPWYKYGLKLHPIDRGWFRPGPMLAFFLSRNIRFEDVTFKNTTGWTAHIRCCDGFTARGVTIDADRTIANSDGFSIDCTRNVEIERCRLLTGDDSFAIRASCRLHADQHPCEHIRIRDCDVSSCCFGVRFGVGTGTIRDVEFDNCRFHESAIGFGFTPAWINTGKNVYIEDVTVRDCVSLESERPVHVAMPAGDARVKNILFERCRFEALLPSSIIGNDNSWPENILFKDCSFKLLGHVKVRQNMHWFSHWPERQNVFLETRGKVVNVRTENCTPSPDAEVPGALLLTFDDRNFDGWLAAIPLFKKYDAHATFFVSGQIDNAVVRAMKTLAGKGHSIGLHGLHHANADEEIAAKGAQVYWDEEVWPQLDTCNKCYVKISGFAYPNCRRSEESDELFFKQGFKRIRGCLKNLTPYDPEGRMQADRKPLATDDRAFFPATELATRKRLDTLLVGEAYHTDIEDILACVRRAAERREVLVITAHDIADDAKWIHMKTEWLERILATAKECGLATLGFGELP